MADDSDKDRADKELQAAEKAYAAAAEAVTPKPEPAKPAAVSPAPSAPEPLAAAPARPAPTTAACGLTTPIDGKEGPTGMLSHDATPETYIITQGSGTLVTGGQMYKGNRSADDSSVVTTLNGPTCGGRVTGNYKERHVGVGDIIIVPAGVPHGWSEIPAGGVTYLSVRPDPKYVLPRNFVYPALR